MALSRSIQSLETSLGASRGGSGGGGGGTHSSLVQTVFGYLAEADGMYMTRESFMNAAGPLTTLDERNKAAICAESMPLSSVESVTCLFFFLFLDGLCFSFVLAARRGWL